MSWFFIESKLNGLVLDIKGGSVKGAQLITWPKHGGSNQLWAWSGDLLVSKTGYVVDVYGSRTAKGTSAIAWDKHGCNNQRWEMVGDQIISKLNDFVLDIKGGCCEAVVDVILWPRHDGSNQQWKITYPEGNYIAIKVVDFKPRQKYRLCKSIGTETAILLCTIRNASGLFGGQSRQSRRSMQSRKVQV